MAIATASDVTSMPSLALDPSRCSITGVDSVLKAVGGHAPATTPLLVAIAAGSDRDAAGGLPLRLVNVAIDAVKRFDLERATADDGFGGIGCYSHAPIEGDRLPTELS